MKTPMFDENMVQITLSLDSETIAWFDRQPNKNTALRALIEKNLGVGESTRYKPKS